MVAPLVALVLSLKLAHDEGSVLDRAFLAPDQLSESIESLGQSSAAWGVEHARWTLAAVEETFAPVPDLPLQQIGECLEALILDLLRALSGEDGGWLCQRFVPSVAHEAARLSVPFEDVIRSMRDTQVRWVGALLADDARAKMTPSVVEELVRGASRLFDEEIARFLAAYMAERAALVESQLARRRDVVRQLLDDTRTEESATDYDDLGIDFGRFHTGIVVTRGTGAPSLDTRRLARSLREAVDGADVLVLPAGDNRVWAWSSTQRPPTSSDHARMEHALSSLRGARSAVRTPASGLSGFRETNRQAEDAAGLAARDDQGASVTFWRDRALLALLTLDPARAQSFVRRVLGPLCAEGEAVSELRLTLGAYLESGESLLRAAENRNVHRNTIVYLLKRAEELLKRPLKQDDLELRCALLMVQTMGSDALQAEV